MNTKSNIIGLLALFVLVGTGYLFLRHAKQFPHSFTINVTGSFTSSGAERDYQGSVTFADGNAVKGSQSYKASGSINSKPWQTSYECTISNGMWVTASDRSSCDKSLLGGGYIEPTVEGITRQINNGDIKPLSACNHLDACYEIVQ